MLLGCIGDPKPVFQEAVLGAWGCLPASFSILLDKNKSKWMIYYEYRGLDTVIMITVILKHELLSQRNERIAVLPSSHFEHLNLLNGTNGSDGIYQ